MPMSYSFSFDQYPTKDFDELLESFIDGKLSTRVDEVLARIATEEKEAETLTTIPKATFYEDREAWIQCERNKFTQADIQGRKLRWSEIKEQIAESETLLRSTRDKKKLRQITASFIKIFIDTAGLAFVPDCTGYSESARDQDYRFLVQLFNKVMHIDLDEGKTMPTTEQWKTFFLALKPDLLAEEFQQFFIEMKVREEEQEIMRQFCLKLLFTVRDLLKTCLQRGWDLHFFSEFGERDLREKALKEKQKMYIQRLIDKAVS